MPDPSNALSLRCPTNAPIKALPAVRISAAMNCARSGSKPVSTMKEIRLLITPLKSNRPLSRLTNKESKNGATGKKCLPDKDLREECIEVFIPVLRVGEKASRAKRGARKPDSPNDTFVTKIRYKYRATRMHYSPHYSENYIYLPECSVDEGFHNPLI